ncbi:unnamed protein product, partial [Heterotrigona itama]
AKGVCNSEKCVDQVANQGCVYSLVPDNSTAGGNGHGYLLTCTFGVEVTVESTQVDRHDGTGENKAGTQGEAERSHASAEPLNHSQPATSWTVPSREDFSR